MSLNTRFINCIDFINNTKKVVASDPTAFQNIYMENAIVHAECDLMEMELAAAMDAEEYDSLISTNILRKGNNRKAKQNGKRNSSKANRLHKADRYHGKHVEPYLYKEDGEIKESIEDVWKRCDAPVSDKIKYSDLAMKAREEEFYSVSYPVEKETKETKVTTETAEEEARNFDDFLWYLIDNLSEERYIVLFSFDNGKSYEDHDECTYEFRGVMTKDEVIVKLTENLLRNDCEVKVSETEVRGLKGARFNWNFGNDEWGWNGYESFTIIPVSHIPVSHFI